MKFQEKEERRSIMNAVPLAYRSPLFFSQQSLVDRVKRLIDTITDRRLTVYANGDGRGDGRGIRS